MTKHKSPVHVVLVSLLVDQLSGLFLIFFGRPKKNLSSIRSFLFTLLNFCPVFFENVVLVSLLADQLVPSMWFWSVSWSTNCPVYFSLFLVDQKKICSVSGKFWSGSEFFGRPNFFLEYQNFFWSPKFFFG